MTTRHREPWDQYLPLSCGFRYNKSSVSLCGALSMRQELFLGAWLRDRVGTRWKQVQNLFLQARSSTLPPVREQWCRFGQDGVMSSGSRDAFSQGPLLGGVVSSRIGGHGMHQLLSP